MGPTGAALLLLTMALVPHAWLEARMMTHMFVQLPLLIAVGVLLGERTRVSRLPALDTTTTVAAFVFVIGIVTTWMIPRALDAAVEQLPVNAGKVLSLVLAGAVGRVAWSHAAWPVRTFVFGNTAWMTASAGLLFLETPARLCTSYGRGEQQQAGVALMAVTVIAVLMAGSYFFRSAPPPAPTP
jgi:hypothetical protein